MVARSVLKLDKGKNADCLVTIIPEQQHAFLYSNIVDSTFHHQPTAGGPPFSPERETYSMLLFVQLLHACLLHRGKSATCYRYSQALTYSILLSTIQQRPGCP